MVSPIEKNGGEVGAPGSAAAGVAQAAAPGGAVAFGSSSSFAGAAGAAPVNQYLATRGEAGWSTANLTPPLLSGTYAAASGDADPYLAFSADLSRAIVSGGWACREGGEECEAENPPLGPGGPPGYRNLYLREGSTYSPLITTSNFAALPPHPSEFHLAFQEASSDLRHVVFSTESGPYEWNEGTIAPVAGGGGGGFVPPGALAVLGSWSDDSIVFYVAADGLYRWHSGAATRLLAAAPAQLPPVAGRAALAAGGRRLFFDTTLGIAVGDTNQDTDVYEWEEDGAGSCAQAAGCIGLISSGRSEDGAHLLGASVSGADAFFTTDRSLVPSDPGAVDLYDAREGGGFPEPPTPIPCEGDACQPLPSPPEDPAPGTLAPSLGNPPVHFTPPPCPRGKHRVKRHGKTRCLAEHHRRHHRRHR